MSISTLSILIVLTVQPGGDAALAAAIARVEHSNSAMRTVFRVGGIGGGSAENPDWRDEADVEWRWFEWTGADGKVRVREFSDNPDAGGELLLTQLWTGRFWAQWQADLSLASVAHSPQLIHVTDAWAHFNMVDWPGPGGIGPLSEMVGVLDVLERSDENDDEGRSVLTFALPNEPDQLIVAVRSAQPLDVSSVRYDWMGPAAQGSDPVLRMRMTCHLDDWRSFGPLRLPMRTIREVYVPTPPPGAGSGPMISRILFVRESVAPIDPQELDPEVFSLEELRLVRRIHDRRINTTYGRGRNEIVHDGFAIPTTQTVEGFFDTKVPPTEDGVQEEDRRSREDDK